MAALVILLRNCGSVMRAVPPPDVSHTAFRDYGRSVSITMPQGDMYGHRPTSGFCIRNMGVIDHAFSLIEADDLITMSILWAWINADRELATLTTFSHTQRNRNQYDQAGNH